MRAFLAALMIVSMTAAASAQVTQGIVDRGKRANESGPQEAPKKRVNEKDYKSSLDRLPDKKFDPWGSVR